MYKSKYIIGEFQELLQIMISEKQQTTINADIDVSRKPLSHALIPIWRNSSLTVVKLEFLYTETVVSLCEIRVSLCEIYLVLGRNLFDTICNACKSEHRIHLFSLPRQRELQ